jgi:hypothetical protein
MKRSAVVITAAVCILGAYDAIAYFSSGEISTLSRVMQDVGLNSPFTAFSVGFICGHIFGYMKPKEKT